MRLVRAACVPPAFAACFSANPFIVFVFSLSLSRASEVVAAFCLWSVWPTRGDSDSAPPGFESFSADDIHFSRTNNFATVIFFCFSSFSCCTFLVMYVVKFCLLSFFFFFKKVMNMSGVRKQSSFCRALVI